MPRTTASDVGSVALLVITLAVWVFACGVAMSIATQARHAMPAERVIIEQFVATYCGLHMAKSQQEADKMIAESALISRMAIRAGVGVAARAAYLSRCGF